MSPTLSSLTTLRVGGKAVLFREVNKTEELIAALAEASENNLSVYPIGEGSNILASDSGFDGMLIKINSRGISYEGEGNEVVVTARAGESWDSFVESTLARGLYGLENLSGIPGTVGAAPIQNIGAYGAEIQDSVLSLEAIDIRTKEARVFTHSQCGFTYRDSFFKSKEGRNFFITSVTFLLKKTSLPNISYKDLAEYFGIEAAPSPLEVREAVLSIRAKKFPDRKKIGTAGSFFKNPIVSEEVFKALQEKFPDLPSFSLSPDTRKIPLAWILDRVCNLRGYREGNIGLFERQPLVLVNFGNASAEEIDVFAKKIIARVHEVTGIKVEREVISLGTFRS